MLISRSHFFLVVIGKDEFLNLFNFMSDNSKLSHYHSLLCSLLFTLAIFSLSLFFFFKHRMK